MLGYGNSDCKRSVGSINAIKLTPIHTSAKAASPGCTGVSKKPDPTMHANSGRIDQYLLNFSISSSCV
jgi:hypothetical protein